ncbi:hypothetical protein RhiJN_09880 [Ceratobasidium sp. AG-Ba]|nr:hypothetical protein RhiJN_09880 [Ceratobasidium sp. AG-Ba]
MPPAANRMFDSTFVDHDWYKDSLARILDNYARENRTHLPTGIYLMLYDAGIMTFCHESRIHLWLKETDGHDAIHPDPNYVRDGYTDALGKLMKLLKSTIEPQASDPHITKVRNDLLQMLEIKFTCLDIDTAVRQEYYKK